MKSSLIFSNCFREMLRVKSFTLSDVSKKTGLSQSTLNRYLQGKSLPRLPSVVKLADCFECSLNRLFGMREPQKKNG